MTTELLYLYSAICDEFLSEISEEFQKWQIPKRNIPKWQIPKWNKPKWLIPKWNNPKWRILSESNQKITKMATIGVEHFGDDALHKLYLDFVQKDDWDDDC